MYCRIILLFLSVGSASIVPLAELSTLSEPSLPTEYSQGLEISGLEFSHGANVSGKLSTRALNPHFQNKTFQLVSLKDEDNPVFETTAPPSTIWQGLPGSQWDDSSKDQVVKAWNMAMKLATTSVASLEDLLPGSNNYDAFLHQTVVVDGVCKAMKSDPTRTTNQYLLCYRTFLAANNLAYGQLFGADPENIQLIYDNFVRIVEQTENLDGNGNGVPGADGFIRDNTPIYLTMGPTLIDTKGENICNGKGPSDAATQAAAVVADGTKVFADSTNDVPADAWLIHFCPAFFMLPRMEDGLAMLENGSAQKQWFCNLNNLDSGARALLHEITHLPWVLNTNFGVRERYGFEVATSSRNADSYAWMSVYNFYNSLDFCQGVKYTGKFESPQSCITDVWPNNVAKLVNNQWPSYTKQYKTS
ncbi:hypothetical protein OIDMADRAFT_55916 [Oidiodendron maius Zn]|uniref:Lysine-specific metallo-endopeptidase domain-containing protein n=1 Tax=Oidiodendron maius (strain Zn) TaxID=913774 RepID=A0A0C3DDJ1_OIDMZ|nr:hypothetical protein OIDMADRAFT_55916 [Oidiodendron maius Zn]